MNIYVVDMEGGDLGVGTFPWDSVALSELGGVVDAAHFGGGQKTLTHEVGHNLGLWHTHHGVTEVALCSACYEKADGTNGDTTGDFASDTDPSPVNYQCAPPGGSDIRSGQAWGPTDPQNNMRYATDAWYTEFSPHQMGRTHCWLEEALSGWTTSGTPCQLDVSYPDGGELLVVGGWLDIRWTSAATSGYARIDLMKQGTLCATLANNTPDDGAHPWQMEPLCGTDTGYQIRIVDAGDAACETASASPFEICGSGPELLEQPEDAVVCEAEAFSLCVTVSGHSPLEYLVVQERCGHLRRQRGVLFHDFDRDRRCGRLSLRGDGTLRLDDERAGHR